MNSDTFPSAVLDGSNWWAMIEQDHDAALKLGVSIKEEARYAKVIAWERVNDLCGEEGKVGLVAWLNGNHPFRSDQVPEVTREYFLNHFTQSPPEGFKEFIWA
ncbi:hypothetical protein ACR9WD_16985 (plasmid) [Glutamicibacter sp. PAEs-4]|uniref:hypothetical protein n=1 Tax=Glutamicibacter sp. PAEs-4 TaxID=3444114 RepID=UPI003EB8EAF5